MGMLCNWFTDLGRSISSSLGQTGVIICIAIFSTFGILLMSNVLRASINKTKIVIKWGQLIFAIIFILLTIWFISLVA